MRRLVAILCLFLAVAGLVPVAAQTPDERGRLDWVQRRGRLLYEIDRAAWVTTDDLTERVGDLARAGVRGWTVERDGAGYAVTYFSGEGAARAALYHGRVENNRVVSAQVFPAGSRPLLTQVQRRLADARGAVARMDAWACARSGLNIAVIPPDASDAPIDLYVLTPQTQTGVYPAGGHSRATLSPTGEVLSQRAFTNGCIELSDRPEGSGAPAALVITHLLDPIPTEIHVFLSIWIGLPVFVGTRDPHRVWEVGGDTIHLVDPPPATPHT